MGKGGWKIFMYTNPEFYLGAKTGGFGKNAKQAADEYEEEMGPILAVLGGLMLFGLAVFGLITLITKIT